MKFLYNFEANNINLCVEIEIRYHLFKIIACFKNCQNTMYEMYVEFLITKNSNKNYLKMHIDRLKVKR